MKLAKTSTLIAKSRKNLNSRTQLARCRSTLQHLATTPKFCNLESDSLHLESTDNFTAKEATRIAKQIKLY